MSDITTTAGCCCWLGDVQDAAARATKGDGAKTIRRQADLRKLPGVIRIGVLCFDLALLGKWLDQVCCR